MASVRDYIAVERALQEKYEEIKRGIITKRGAWEEKYQPLIQPLRDLGKQLAVPKVSHDHNDQHKHLPALTFESKSSSSGHVLGPLATKYLGFNASTRKDLKT